MRAAFRRVVLRKYEVQYSQCMSCGFVQTEEPHWLTEAYANPIASADTGILQRNLYLSRVTSVVLWRLFGGKGKFLDAAGGYGIFTRLMRDAGFDYYWCDPHAPNLVARGFEGGQAQGPYSAVSAFEVLEHVVDPLGFLSGLLRDMGTRTLIVSTELFEGDAPDPERWWYYAFDTGQHISFYRRSTLEVIGRKLGLRLYSNRNVHLWTDERVSQLGFRLTTHPISSAVLSWAPRSMLESRVWPDHHQSLRS
jgi:hypothetical protein